ncbi:MAG: hypothetical protein N2C14_20570, partial [Planctomycetales bacterium]
MRDRRSPPPSAKDATVTLRESWLEVPGMLTLAFASLIGMSLLSTIIIRQRVAPVAEVLDRTQNLRVPTSTASNNARAYLLEMQLNIRSYLSLGDKQYRKGFQAAQQGFEKELSRLETVSEGGTRLAQIQALNALYEEWTPLPKRIFDEHDDPLRVEPAKMMLIQDEKPRVGKVLAATAELIAVQAERPSSPENYALMRSMADFRGSFATMAASLRGYLATLDSTFQDEYKTAFAENNAAWEQLSAHQETLTETQRELFTTIQEKREEFLVLPTWMTEAAAGDQARTDLFLL